jgi:hypothetical protein
VKGKALSEIINDTYRLIGLLQHQMDVILSAGQGLNNLKNPVPHPYQPTSARYSGGSKGAEQIQARQAIADATAKAERVKEKLLKTRIELQRRLDMWNDNLDYLRNDPKEIKEARSVANHYQKGQRDALNEKNQIVKTLNAINSELNKAQQRMSRFSGYTGSTSGGGIDEIVRKEDTKSKFTAQNNYGLLPVTYETVPLLDADRYGKANYQFATEYPMPNLASTENKRTGTLPDKINQGFGYTDIKRIRNYQIKLPAYVWKAFSGIYMPQSGSYSAQYLRG